LEIQLTYIGDAMEIQWRYVRETGDTWRLVETNRDTVERPGIGDWRLWE